MNKIVYGSAIAAIVAVGCVDGNQIYPDLLQPRDAAPLAFGNPADCGTCHENHYNEWRISNHAYAIKDPVYVAMTKAGQAASQGKLGQFCAQCHSYSGMVTGQTTVSLNETTGVYEQNVTDIDEIALSGVSCDVCHSITEVIEPLNARAALTPNGTRRGPIQDPVATQAHVSEYSPLHEESMLCGMCHAVINPKGATVEETFPEWQGSSFAQKGVTCQGCHMPEYTGKAVTAGDEVDLVPERTLHRHFMVGVDVSLLPPGDFPGYDELRTMVEEILGESATLALTARAGDRALDATVVNITGHALPSGATAERQMWIELIVRRTADNQIVFESGTLDENGDLRDGVDGHSTQPGSDPQMAFYGQAMMSIAGFADLDAAGKEAARASVDAACLPMGQGAVQPDLGFTPVPFPWQADWQCNYMIPVDSSDLHTYDLSGLAGGEYTATARLLFRTFPPHFMRKLEEVGGLDPAVKDRVPIVVMEEDSVTFTLP